MFIMLQYWWGMEETCPYFCFSFQTKASKNMCVVHLYLYLSLYRINTYLSVFIMLQYWSGIGDLTIYNLDLNTKNRQIVHLYPCVLISVPDKYNYISVFIMLQYWRGIRDLSISYPFSNPRPSKNKQEQGRPRNIVFALLFQRQTRRYNYFDSQTEICQMCQKSRNFLFTFKFCLYFLIWLTRIRC